ncbi:MAG: Spy/CpxP family protein refolding chaperone [Phycisphaeraceae bacterium]|nr:Spy/CpxP family protein refolding chaperone [Phycisphaeraceae bacterium]
MTTTTKHLIPTLLLALTLTLVAEAQPGQGMIRRGRSMRSGQNQRGPGMQSMDRRGPGPGMGRTDAPGMMGIMPLLRRLDLTQEQHEAVRTILDGSKEATQAAHEAVQVVRQSLHQAVMDESDEAAIRAIATAMAKAVGDEAIKQVAVTKEIKSVLTEAQKNELITLISQGPEDRRRGPQGPPSGMGRGPGRGRMQGRRPAGPDPIRE